jgi:hypothetical protein
MPEHYISVAAAATMTARCRSEKEDILTTGNRNSGVIPICETFSRSALDAILSDTNCTKVRIYTAMDTDLKLRFVIVGVNEDDEDIFLSDTANESVIPSVIENGIRCPDDCPVSSSLNS